MKKILLVLLILGFSSKIKAQNDSLQNSGLDPVHLREVPRHNFLVDVGIAQSVGDYSDIARAGLNINTAYLYQVHKNLGLELSLNHQYNEFTYLDYQNSETVDASQNNYTMTAIGIGPSFSYTKRRFQIDFSVKSGVVFFNNPDNRVTELGFGNTLVFENDPAGASSSSSFIAAGIRFNYYFRRSVQVYFAPQYFTSLGEPIAYSVRDEQSTAPIAPSKSVRINASNLLFNIGVKIAIGKTYSNGEQRIDDW